MYFLPQLKHEITAIWEMVTDYVRSFLSNLCKYHTRALWSRLGSGVSNSPDSYASNGKHSTDRCLSVKICWLRWQMLNDVVRESV